MLFSTLLGKHAGGSSPLTPGPQGRIFRITGPTPDRSGHGPKANKKQTHQQALRDKPNRLSDGGGGGGFEPGEGGGGEVRGSLNLLLQHHYRRKTHLGPKGDVNIQQA